LASQLAGNWQEETLASIVCPKISRVHLVTVKAIPRLAATIFAMGAALGVAGIGAAVDAQAQPAPFPDYHWCPGQFWDPGWGPNWDGGNCHDDYHRDIDGPDHSRDWHQGPGGPGYGHQGPNGPWEPGR
jgi:hypothetical protein